MSISVRAPRPADWYRAVWRWHFYAGLLVLPFLILLAVTGAIYLFRSEIEQIIYRDLKSVAVSTQAALPHQRLATIALAAYPGTLFKYVPPALASNAAEATIKTVAGENLAIYIDPYRGTILGCLPEKGGVLWTLRHLHSLAYFGPVANALIEVAAGWSILLVLSGIFLWWPRGRRGGVVTVRRRTLWRDLHAVTGIFVAFFIVFLAVTGMPWSLVWGKTVNQWANGNNFGYPEGVRVSVPMSDEHLDHLAPTSWSLKQAQVPFQPPHHVAKAMTLDQAVVRFDALGLSRGYAINPPLSASAVYTGSVYPNDLLRQRVIHLDQYSGKALLDMRYADYGPLGKALEWGINVHLGQQFGLANQLVLLVACIAIVILCVSAALMWWQRRPVLGPPPLPLNLAAQGLVVALMAIGGLIFPLTGLSMLVIWLFDMLLVRRRR
ncbi:MULTISPECIES: PepSY domain-containing protein [unclassified Undibacterium]|uniref:PepSY-associated TM helix domain-containing protein n=1 Tax=unclassified Undibacterium TaxID=2630295 RepID=UPI002AC90E8C|nr:MULTISPECIES: PepSY domain-containing protein [unclassified Undibacterium]MEB0139654.1 PepSY domain-containing protein [Undibacterium sp. CCC2.1]MEB0172535.1 PepSY domain-containing protein [Undibacterium sp. CCC1.1]MEB0176370.1 PepSY domain-containing protein [Undibacterium sp. CCC3.4]MEB0215704.1 PepSY domain-containing protein [Undibacterium sp. 5I2]WPX42981.1 PepSY domain-containing protein [Undibacterium sp. CCC3.4]